MIWLCVAVAGALGAACRYALDEAVSARAGGLFPWGTLLVNVSGSLLAGVVVALAAEAVVPVEVRTVVAGGFLGAYTTFSTAMYETLCLLEERVRPMAVANLLGQLALATLAAVLGWVLVT